MCHIAVSRAEALALGFKVSPAECETALRQRHSLAAMYMKLDCGMVDVLDLI